MKTTENTNGFLSRWLLCGPVCTEISAEKRSVSQEAFEEHLRSVLPDDRCTVPDSVRPGEKYQGGIWRYRYTGNNIFVDLSDFYFHLCRVDYYAFTEVEAEQEGEGRLCLWCCPATDVWVNGEKIISHDVPVYKPMHRAEAVIKLRKGKNTVFVRCQNLGVRDTRNLFALQIEGGSQEIKNTLPDPNGKIRLLMETDAWLDEVKPKGQLLTAPSEPPVPCLAELDGRKVLWESGNVLETGEDCREIKLSVSLNGERLMRERELPENDRPFYRSLGENISAHRKEVLEELTELGKVCSPEDEKGLYAYGVYARMAQNGGKISAEDRRILMHSLDVVDSCSDCSDFSLSVLLRILLTFSIEDDALIKRMKQVVLDFRYWTDEPGSDAMCFDSENHMLLFHGCQMAAGRLFPNEIFTRSGRTGKEMERIGSKRCIKWLEKVLRDGFEEFLSEVYMCITAAAILMLVDYGSREVRTSAEKVMVNLLEQLSRHAFHGAAIGPMGRAYRDVIAPHRQGMQSLLHYISPKAPVRRTYFLSVFATSSFAIPENLPHMMGEPVSMVYRSGSAEINLEKTEDYLLSSVSCPAEKYADVIGESPFVPGAYGYQQHLWYAALDADCAAFINHPGVSKDKCEMRPGYWYGNGIMPALRQEGRVLGVIYHLDKRSHPISFTHLFWPSYSLEESITDAHWHFGRKGSGYMAVWSNIAGVPFDDVLCGCEYRFTGDHQAFLCVLGSAQEDGSFQEFIETTKKMSPGLSEGGGILRTETGFSLEYPASELL